MTLERPMFPEAREIETIEPFGVTPIFCDTLVRVEHIGPCRQLVFSIPEQSYPGRPVRSIVAKLILPAETLQAVAAQLLAHAAAPADAATAALSAAPRGATAH